MNLTSLLERSQKSSFAMWQLNFILHRFIPFNKPHKLKIMGFDKNKVEVSLPYTKKNLNHIKGLHACALATAAEYASGLLLLYKLGSKDFRIIMESIEVNYKYQGKMDAIATFSISEQEFQETVLGAFNEEGIAFKRCKIVVSDSNGNLLCEAFTNWQIKKWDKVKTKS